MEFETKAVTLCTRTLSSQSKNCWLFIHVGAWAFWFWRFWRMDNKDGGVRFDYFSLGRCEERRKSANKTMRIKLGPDNGNSGAIIRCGKYLEYGVWFRVWNFRKLWTQWRFRPRAGLWDFGVFTILLPEWRESANDKLTARVSGKDADV